MIFLFILILYRSYLFFKLSCLIHFHSPSFAHTFAKSSLIFQLVNLKNNISVNDSLILKKIKERNHAHSALGTLSKIPYYQDISMNALYTHVAHANRWNNQIIMFLYSLFKDNILSLINCSSYSLNHFLLISVHTSYLEVYTLML